MTEAATTERPATAIAEYSPTAAALADLRARYQNVVWDVTTTKGDKEARAARRELVTLRTTLEAKRKELKAPALERTRLIDAEAKSIEAQIRALEDPIDALISAEEQRRERERQVRIAAEQERVAGIQRRIERFASYAVRAMGFWIWMRLSFAAPCCRPFPLPWSCPPRPICGSRPCTSSGLLTSTSSTSFALSATPTQYYTASGQVGLPSLINVQLGFEDRTIAMPDAIWSQRPAPRIRRSRLVIPSANRAVSR